MNDLLIALLFFMPAGYANMAPVFANKIPLLNRWKTPIDFGFTIGKHRLFGDNKTWRGLLFGTLVGGLTAVIISKLNAGTVVTIPPFWAGSLMGFGALAGDAIESFLKRRVGIKPGESWFPFDQTDYIIGGLVMIAPFVHLPITVIIRIFVLYFGLHLAASYTGYLLGLKERPI